MSTVVAVALLALVVRVGFVAWNWDVPAPFDAVDYIRHGESIAAGDGYPGATFVTSPSDGPTAFRPPGYPYVLGAAFALAGSKVAVARAVGVLLGVAAVVLTMLIAIRLWDDAIGLVAGLITATFPPLVALSPAVLSETLYVPLELGAVLALLAYRDNPERRRWVVLAGVLCGMAALTRTAGLFIVPAALLAVWLPPRRSLRRLVGPAVLALAFAATLLPWTVRNETTFGRFIPVSDQSGFSLVGAYNRQFASGRSYEDQWRSPASLREFRRLYNDRSLDEPELMARLGDRARAYIEEHPTSVAPRLLVSVERLFAFGPGGRGAAFGPYVEMSVRPSQMTALSDSALLVFLLALAGAVLLVIRAGAPSISRPPAFVWWIPILSVAPVLIATASPRYRAPLDPFACMLAAVTLTFAYRAAADRRAAAG